MSLIPHRLKKMKFITLNREVHKWLGIALALFTLIISLTGFVLIHKKEWKWMKNIEVTSWLIPGWYADEMAKKGKEIKSLAFVPEAHAAKATILAGTKAGLASRQNGTWTASSLQAGGEEISSLLIASEQWFAGTHRGLYRSRDKGETWELVKSDLWQKPERLEVKTLAQSPEDLHTIWMGTKMGLYRSMDGGSHWEDFTHYLPDEEHAREVTALAFPAGLREVVLIGTHNGLYRYDGQAMTMAALNTDGLTQLSQTQTPHLTLDKYLDKLHDGKLFGDKLWLLYDLTAWSFVLFVATGLYIWIYPKSVKRKKEREQAKLAANKSVTTTS